MDPLTWPDWDNGGTCLEGINLKNSAEAVQTIHKFPPSIADGHAIHLVDPSRHKLKDPGKAIKRGDSVGDAISWISSRIAQRF